MPLQLTLQRNTTANGHQPVAERLQSLDALRGFDMFWIMGGDAVYIHVICRGLILVALGILYNNGLRFNFDGLRYGSVLGRIGLAWMFLYILYKKRIFLKV